MILVDTSVWVQHFRSGMPALSSLLVEGRVVMHPFVIGELALGSMAQRDRTLDDLSALPNVPSMLPEEVLTFINRRELFGLGLGYVDVNLLASTLIGDAIRLWTIDRRLAGAANILGVGYN